MTTVVSRMWEFGENVGIAFQIKDDLFDYDRSVNTGKPHAIDIKDQKMTLPLIYLLNKVDLFEKRKIISIVKNHGDDTRKVNELIQKVAESGGIEYARKMMTDYRGQALDILHTFPEGQYRDSLEQLVIFTTDRQS